MQTLKKEGLRMANFSILSVFKPVVGFCSKMRVLKGVIFVNYLIFIIVNCDFSKNRKMTI